MTLAAAAAMALGGIACGDDDSPIKTDAGTDSSIGGDAGDGGTVTGQATLYILHGIADTAAAGIDVEVNDLKVNAAPIDFKGFAGPISVAAGNIKVEVLKGTQALITADNLSVAANSETLIVAFNDRGNNDAGDNFKALTTPLTLPAPTPATNFNARLIHAAAGLGKVTVGVRGAACNVALASTLFTQVQRGTFSTTDASAAAMPDAIELGLISSESGATPDYEIPVPAATLTAGSSLYLAAIGAAANMPTVVVMKKDAMNKLTKAGEVAIAACSVPQE